MLNADVRKEGRGGWSNADTCGQGEGVGKRIIFFADVLYGRPHETKIVGLSLLPGKWLLPRSSADVLNGCLTWRQNLQG